MIVVEELSRLFCFFSILIDTDQKLVVLEGVLNELVLVKLPLHCFNLLIASCEDLFEFTDLVGVLACFVICILLISVVYFSIMWSPSLNSLRKASLTDSISWFFLVATSVCCCIFWICMLGTVLWPLHVACFPGQSQSSSWSVPCIWSWYFRFSP